MKTRNIRWMMLMLALAMMTNASAQKNVLKAFDKVRDSKDVVMKKVNNQNGLDGSQKWQCNVTEFHFPKLEDARKLIDRIEKAFVKDGRMDNVIYFTRIKALGSNPTEEEKNAYKKIMVKCTQKSEVVTIGSDPSYHLMVLRCHSTASSAIRTVVAIEWMMMPGKGCSGRFYEIEGHNETLWEEPYFRYPYQSAQYRPAKEEVSNNMTTRMHFYRDTYDGKDNSENSALLLNMTEYLKNNWGKASEGERNIAVAIMIEMTKRSKSEIHRGIINQCVKTLESPMVDQDVMSRIELYIKEYNMSNSHHEKGNVLERLRKYVSKVSKTSYHKKTFNRVYERLLQMKNSANVHNHQIIIGEIMGLLEE